MNPKIFKLVLFLVVALLVCMFNGCAENEPTAPEETPIPIETSILAGPAENEVLGFNSAATFSWDGEINPGHITAFTYLLLQMGATTDTLYINTALERTFSESELGTGDYRFVVYAHGVQDDSEYVDQTPAVRNFSVGTADALAPVITIDQGPKQDSYASTGSSVFFEWSATDPSPAGGIVSYEYALADISVAEVDLEWSEPRLETTQMSFYNLANGSYRFWAKANDVGGSSATASRDFVIKTPDVLFAIDGPYSAADIKFWHENALRDFAYEDYNVSDKADFISKLQSGQYSSVVWAWKNDFSALLDSAEFVDVTEAGTVAEAVYNYAESGGHLWVIGAEIMYGLDAAVDALDWQEVIEGTDTSYVTGPNTFARKVLHVTDWNEDDFQGCVATAAGQAGNYPDMIVDGQATFSWCDFTPPTDDAVAIYNFSTGALEGEPCAVRYPSDAPNPGDTKVVYMAFYLTDSTQPAAMKTSDVYNMATTLFTAFGENED
jgi:hypothetical protein